MQCPSSTRASNIISAQVSAYVARARGAEVPPLIPSVLKDQGAAAPLLRKISLRCLVCIRTRCKFLAISMCAFYFLCNTYDRKQTI